MASSLLSHAPSAPHSVVERALRHPASMIWLGHVSVTTARFDEALAFYVSTLGLALRTVDAHPLFPDRLRAVLIDAEGHDVLELLEASAQTNVQALDASRPFHQMSFRLPRRTWQLLRARLSANDVPFQEMGTHLYLHDTDGILLRIEALGDC